MTLNTMPLMWYLALPGCHQVACVDLGGKSDSCSEMSVYTFACRSVNPHILNGARSEVAGGTTHQ
jgi:hypothetical protein